MIRLWTTRAKTGIGDFPHGKCTSDGGGESVVEYGRFCVMGNRPCGIVRRNKEEGGRGKGCRKEGGGSRMLITTRAQRGGEMNESSALSGSRTCGFPKVLGV